MNRKTNSRPQLGRQQHTSHFPPVGVVSLAVAWDSRVLGTKEEAGTLLQALGTCSHTAGSQSRPLGGAGHQQRSQWSKLKYTIEVPVQKVFHKAKCIQFKEPPFILEMTLLSSGCWGVFLEMIVVSVLVFFIFFLGKITWAILCWWSPELHSKIWELQFWEQLLNTSPFLGWVGEGFCCSVHPSGLWEGWAKVKWATGTGGQYGSHPLPLVHGTIWVSHELNGPKEGLIGINFI